MSSVLSGIWPYLSGAFVGWLVAGLLARLFAKPPATVERIVERVVERTVQRPFDNSAYLGRIRAMEKDAAAEAVLVAGLRSQIHLLQATSPKTVEKYIDRIVEVTVPDVQALEAKDNELAALRAQLAAAQKTHLDHAT